MEVVERLKFSLESFLNGKGFQDLKNEIKGSKSMFSSLQSMAGSTLGKMAIGYFSVTGVIGQYRKAIEESNFAIEQQTKLYATLRGQSFEDSQIQNIIDYTSVLQEVGVVSDDVTMAGVQQLATYNLTEESLKTLIPAMQDVLVQQKGLKGTGQDAVGVANLLAKGLLGQTGILQKAGITLTEYQEKMIKTGKQEEKVASLVEAVTMNVGYQNKEFLKTPEGKITSAQNRISDMYEYWGTLVRDTRADFWALVADNAEGIKDIVAKVFKGGSAFVDTFMGVFRDVRRGFNALPDGAKAGMKGIASIALATKFPLVALLLSIDDIFGAFQGKESFTEDAINAVLKFTGTDYKFEDLRNSVNDFWGSLVSPAQTLPQDMGNLTSWLLTTWEILKGLVGTTEMFVGALGLVWDSGKFVKDLVTEDLDTANENFNNGIGKKIIKEGWKTLSSAGSRISEIGDANIEYKDGLKRQEQIENIKNFYSAKKSKISDIADIEFLGKNNIKGVNAPFPTGFENPMKQRADVPFSANFENLKKQSGDIQVNSNPKINVNVTINEATDGREVQKKVEEGVKNGLKEYEKDLRFMLNGSLIEG